MLPINFSRNFDKLISDENLMMIFVTMDEREKIQSIINFI